MSILLGPAANRRRQNVYFSLGICSVKYESDSALTFRNGGIVNWERTEICQLQIEDEPKIETLPGSDGHAVRQKLSRFPVFANRDREDAHIGSLIPDIVGSYDLKEVLDKMLDILLGLDTMLSLEDLVLDAEGKNKRSKWKGQFLPSALRPFSTDCILLELLQP